MKGYNIDDYIGKKFNHLTLIKNLNKLDKRNSKLALFKCDCGNTKEMAFTQVLNNKVKTCGCEQGKTTVNSQLKKQKSLLDFYTSKTQKNNKTGTTGITIVNGKYRVRINLNKKAIHIRIFRYFRRCNKSSQRSRRKIL